MMSLIYRDRTIVADESGITILGYSFPLLRPRTITWAEILGVEIEKLKPWNGRFRVWGKGFRHRWFNFDRLRFRRDRLFVLTLASDNNTAAGLFSSLKPALTPAYPDSFMMVLREHCSALNT